MDTCVNPGVLYVKSVKDAHQRSPRDECSCHGCGNWPSTAATWRSRINDGNISRETAYYVCREGQKSGVLSGRRNARRLACDASDTFNDYQHRQVHRVKLDALRVTYKWHVMLFTVAFCKAMRAVRITKRTGTHRHKTENKPWDCV